MKTRLINANYLKCKFNQTDLEERGFYPNNLVDSCPTIDAIPFAWITKWQKTHPTGTVSDMLSDWKKTK